LESGAPILNGGFLLVVAVKGLYCTIGPMSADQYKQVGIRGGARYHQLRGGFIEQHGNFEKSQKLKGRSEKFKNP
jgi:hypothetical protein